MQAFKTLIPWEIILVDNNSTDGMSQVARELWNSKVPLIIINEPKQGVGHARLTGINACQYEYIAFIDDDNWVAHDWLENAFIEMNKHLDAGAIAGFNQAVFESPPPNWFKAYQGNYAVGPPARNVGKLQGIHTLSWSAGLIIRRSAWGRVAKNRL